MCHEIYTRNVNNYPLLGPCKRGAEWGFPLPPISLSISMGEPWGQHTLYTKSNFHSWFSSLTWFPKPNGTCTSFVVYANNLCIPFKFQSDYLSMLQVSVQYLSTWRFKRCSGWTAHCCYGIYSFISLNRSFLCLNELLIYYTIGFCAFSFLIWPWTVYSCHVLASITYVILITAHNPLEGWRSWGY